MRRASKTNSIQPNSKKSPALDEHPAELPADPLIPSFFLGVPSMGATGKG